MIWLKIWLSITTVLLFLSITMVIIEHYKLKKNNRKHK